MVRKRSLLVVCRHATPHVEPLSNTVMPSAVVFQQTAKLRGSSLIELILFIVIVSVALAGILLVMNTTTRASADPLIRKQALAIAESLMEEVQLMPLTFCDPDDANVITAANVAGCATVSEDTAIGAEPGETRYSSTTPFDNVSDYHNFAMNAGNGGIRDISNVQIANLAAYTATIAMRQAAWGGIAAADSLLITVTVTAPNGEMVALDSYRTRYSPNGAP